MRKSESVGSDLCGICGPDLPPSQESSLSGKPAALNTPFPTHLSAHTHFSPLHPWSSQVWRGEHFAATRAEYTSIKNQLMAETFPPAPPKPGARPDPSAPPPQPRTWEELGQEERQKMLQDRLKKYTQKVGALCRTAVPCCVGLAR